MARPPPGRHRRALLSRTALRRVLSTRAAQRSLAACSCRDRCRVSASTRGRVQVPVLIGGQRDTVFYMLGAAFVRWLSPPPKQPLT